MSNEGNNKSTVGSVIATVVLVIASAVAGWVAREHKPESKNDKALAMPPPQTQSVAVTEVKEMAYNLAEKFVAHAEAMQEVDLLPQVDGYIKEMVFIQYRLGNRKYRYS